MRIRRDYLNQEYSKTPTEAQDEVEGAFLLDVVIRERAPVLELLASEDKTLLVRGQLGAAGRSCVYALFLGGPREPQAPPVVLQRIWGKRQNAL